jgi:transposase-like protein
MPRTHKPYDATFRQQAVELLLTSGKPQREVARDLGICVETLRDWKKQHTAKPDASRHPCRPLRRGRSFRSAITSTTPGELARCILATRQNRKARLIRVSALAYSRREPLF